MADAKITELTAIDAVAGGDLIPIVDDPAGTPATKKATASQIKDYILSLANTWTATQTIDPADNTSALAVSGFSLTGSNAQSLIDLSGTWNTTGTPSAIKLNMTDTASNASSLLMDLQVGGSSRFSILKSGVIRSNGTTASLTMNDSVGSVIAYGSTKISVAGGQIDFEGVGVGFRYSSNALGFLSDQSLGWRSGIISTSIDTFLTRRGAANLRLGAADAAAPVAQTLSVQSVAAGQTNVAGANLTITGSQGTGTGAGGSIIFQVAPAGSSGTAQNSLVTFLEATSARAFNLYNTADVTTNYERGKIAWDTNVLKIGTEKAGTGTARGIEIQTDGVTRISISAAGAVSMPSISVGSVTSSGFLAAAAAAAVVWAGRSYMTSPADSRILLQNNANTDFDRLQFGGTTASFPALKRSSTTIQARLADDSGYASIQGKLTTETAYTASAPTPTGYLVLYDSGGTAYKVPAEAL